MFMTWQSRSYDKIWLRNLSRSCWEESGWPPRRLDEFRLENMMCPCRGEWRCQRRRWDEFSLENIMCPWWGEWRWQPRSWDEFRPENMRYPFSNIIVKWYPGYLEHGHNPVLCRFEPYKMDGTWTYARLVLLYVMEIGRNQVSNDITWMVSMLRQWRVRPTQPGHILVIKHFRPLSMSSF